MSPPPFSSSTPARTFWPYLGDYVRLLAVGTDFHGVFCGNNTPDNANFPNGVAYQRAADFTTHKLFNTNGVTQVAPSIDPFYFHWTDNPIIRGRGIVPTTPIQPIQPRTIQPIQPIQPINPILPIQPVTPIIPINPINPITIRPISREPIISPIGPKPGPGQGAANLHL